MGCATFTAFMKTRTLHAAKSRTAWLFAIAVALFAEYTLTCEIIASGAATVGDAESVANLPQAALYVDQVSAKLAFVLELLLSIP